MELRNLVIIGVLVLALIAVPVMAEPSVPGGVNNVGSTPIAVPASSDEAQKIPIQGINPSVAYTNWFYTWAQGTAAKTESYGNSYVSYATDYGWGHRTGIVKWAGSGEFPYAWVDCPLTDIASYSGIHPLVRYGTLRYRTETPVAGAYVPRIDFYSGSTFIKTITTSGAWSSPSLAWTEMTFDLGSYYDFNRGFNADVKIANDDTTGRIVEIGGFGAKGEW